MTASADRPRNAQVQTPAVLILDTSGSMAGPPIEALNAAVPEFLRAVREHPVAVKSTHLLVLGAGGDTPRVLQEFTPVMESHIPPLTAAGGTPLGAAVSLALDRLEARQAELNAHGLGTRSALALLISDGAPTDPPEELAFALQRVRRAQENGQLTLFCIGVAGADLAALEQFSFGRPPLPLQGNRFGPLLQSFGASVRQVSVSQVGQKVALGSVDGWASLPG